MSTELIRATTLEPGEYSGSHLFFAVTNREVRFNLSERTFNVGFLPQGFQCSPEASLELRAITREGMNDHALIQSMGRLGESLKISVDQVVRLLKKQTNGEAGFLPVDSGRYIHFLVDGPIGTFWLAIRYLGSGEWGVVTAKFNDDKPWPLEAFLVVPAG